jgi:hypothetical protein
MLQHINPIFLGSTWKTTTKDLLLLGATLGLLHYFNVVEEGITRITISGLNEKDYK